jgi:hypothetical protein
MQQTIEQKPPNFKSYSVRVADLGVATSEAERLGIKKSDFLGVLLRGWRKLNNRQQLSCIPAEPTANNESELAGQA